MWRSHLLQVYWPPKRLDRIVKTIKSVNLLHHFLKKLISQSLNFPNKLKCNPEAIHSRKNSNSTLFISHSIKTSIFKNNKITQKFLPTETSEYQNINECTMYMHDAKEFKFYIYINIIVKFEKLWVGRKQYRIIAEWVSLVTKKLASNMMSCSKNEDFSS